MQIDPVTLSAAAGILLSLALSYIPGLRTKYADLHSDWKRLIMLGALLIVTIGIAMLSCTKLIPYIPCTVDGILDLIGMFIAALIANQAIYPISPKATDVKMLKEAKG
jgi:hypothetical protein